jgi:hypothetical protein
VTQLTLGGRSVIGPPGASISILDRLMPSRGSIDRAGPVEVYTRPDGRVIHRLTEDGGRVATMLALAGEVDAGVVLDALLDAEDWG